MSIDDVQVWFKKEDEKADRLMEAFKQAVHTDDFADASDKLEYQLGRVSVLRELLKQLQAEQESRRAQICITSAGRDALRSMEIAAQRPPLEAVAGNKGADY